ncbi:MAG: hypothetical protein PHS57_06970 [Alphaproteobacteria bacterium]|nr:hypothetical protein [Alphaproteobacteria bacterium]
MEKTFEKTPHEENALSPDSLTPRQLCQAFREGFSAHQDNASLFSKILHKTLLLSIFGVVGINDVMASFVLAKINPALGCGALAFSLGIPAAFFAPGIKAQFDRSERPLSAWNIDRRGMIQTGEFLYLALFSTLMTGVMIGHESAQNILPPMGAMAVVCGGLTAWKAYTTWKNVKAVRANKAPSLNHG